MSLAGRFLLAAALLLGAFLPRGAAAGPADRAAEIREALFRAQLALSSAPEQAAAELETAVGAYGGAFAQGIRAADPPADARITAGLAKAKQALAAGDAPGLADARAQIWTAILAGAYRAVILAVEEKDIPAARAWLLVREFRAATRLSTPGAGATRALEAYARAEIDAAQAVTAIEADLLDTYQGLFNAALQELAAPEEQAFPTRRAEWAGLAQGYFAILAPAYAGQFGAAAPAEVQAELAAAAGDPAAARRLQEKLADFRAAPLTAQDQAARAGRLLRYLDLVAVEYKRGVNRGQVIREIEIYEALSFYEGAYSAYLDLENVLAARAPADGAAPREQFEALGRALQTAAQSGAAPEAEVIQQRTAELRALLAAAMPPEWAELDQGDAFDLIGDILNQMEAAVARADYAAAEAARLEAYSMLETGPEARLMSFAPELNTQVEELFWNGSPQVRGLANLIAAQAAAQEVRGTRTQLDQLLAQARTVLSANSAPLSIALNAGMILFREGLEAVIILASLMSSLRRKEEQRWRKPMALGALAALLATLLTWIVAQDVLQSLAQYGEKLEAVISILAIAVLLVIMNWFFHKVYWTDWIAGFHARKRKLLNGEMGLWFGLVLLGFTSVYREGFETVLFLQALVVQSGLPTVLSGVAGGLAAVGLVALLTFKLQVILPYKKMLVATGILLGAVLLQMAGNTVHVVQLVGWLPIHAIHSQPFPYWLGTWFGLYGTWEGIGFQALAAAFILGSYFLAEGGKGKRARRAPNGALEKREAAAD